MPTSSAALRLLAAGISAVVFPMSAMICAAGPGDEKPRAEPKRAVAGAQFKGAGPNKGKRPKAFKKGKRTMETSFRGPLPDLTADQTALSKRLRHHVEKLAGEIGERNLVKYAELMAAEKYIEDSFTDAGYGVRRQSFEVSNRNCDNLETILGGGKLASEIVVVGAHYDSVRGAPGANDNGSGVAALLECARALAGDKPQREIRFVAFVNEEPPYFQTDAMGSRVYARACRRRDENIVAVLSLETMGYYSDLKDSQMYPPPLNLAYPDTGNFIGFVSNLRSRGLLDETVKSFRRHAKFPSEKGALPAQLPGVGWSDHWSFWEEGYPGVMVTDTAPFRYPHYHTAEDTPDKIDYDRLARVVDGLVHVVRDLARVAVEQ